MSWIQFVKDMVFVLKILNYKVIFIFVHYK